MTPLDAYHLLAENAFAGVETSDDPASHLLAVYGALAIAAEAMGLLDEADAARAAAAAISAADAAKEAAHAEQLNFKTLLGLNGQKPFATTSTDGKDGGNS